MQKTKHKHSQSGAAHLVLMVVLVFIVAGGFLAWRIMNGRDSGKKSTSTASSQANSTSDSDTPTAYIEWSFNGQKWMPMNQGKPAPACKEPLNIGAPMDLSKATSRLYPGQVRGGDFKPHGGIGNENATNTKLDVLMPYSAYLLRGAKYRELGDVQYVLDFIAPCGILVRFDHLRTLSPELQKLTKDLPTNGEGDSRTTKFNEHALVKQGDKVAVEVGYESPLNVFFDLGVYDLRGPNAASKDPKFANEPKRKADMEQSYFSLCWFDLLTGSDKTTVAALPPRGAEGATSDYCK